MEKKRGEEGGKKWSLKNFLIRSIDTSIEQTRIFSNGSQIHFHNKYPLFQSTYHMKIQLTIIYFDKNIVPPPLFLYTYVQKFSNGNCNSRAKGISFNWLKNTSVDKIRRKKSYRSGEKNSSLIGGQDGSNRISSERYFGRFLPRPWKSPWKQTVRTKTFFFPAFSTGRWTGTYVPITLLE